MEKEFVDFEQAVFQCGVTALDSQVQLFDGQSDLCITNRFEPNDTPNLLRKSMERFLIGNVI